MVKIRLYWIFFAIFAALWLTGCSTKVTVKALEPAPVYDPKIRSVAFYPIDRDTVGLREKLQAAASAVCIEGKPWFRIVDRNDLDKILYEIKTQESPLSSGKIVAEAGRLAGASAIVTGKILTAAVKDTPFYEKRTECVDKKCKETREYRVYCTKRRGTLSAELRVVDAGSGEVIHSETIRKSDTERHCMDDDNALPSRSAMLDSLADRVADAFIARFTPTYTYREVELMDKPVIDLSDDDEKRFDNALAYIEHGRYDRAMALLGEILHHTKDQSIAAAYNLGVLKEMQGDFQAARTLYRLADRHSPEPNEMIDRAIVRVGQEITESEAAKSQLKQ